MTPEKGEIIPMDPWVGKFLAHLAADRGASKYTQRNYRQTLLEFCRWHAKQHGENPSWKNLQRDDFRSYLRFLGRGELGRAAIQLRFSGLRSFYKFLIRRGHVETSPIKSIALPKLEKRLPQFLTVQQMLTLLEAPLLPLKPALAKQSPAKKQRGRPLVLSACYRDCAILETI